MSKISRYFRFPDLESKHFWFLLFFVSMICKSVVKIFLKKQQNKNEKNENEKNIESFVDDFFKLYVYLIGDFLSIIPHLIVKYRMKNIDKIDDKIEKVESINDDNINESKIIYNHYEPKEKNKCTIFKDMLKYTIFDFIAQIGNTIYLYILYEKNLVEGHASFNSITLISIFAILIFNYIFLGSRFYRYHCFALIINIICLLILIIFDIIDITNNIKESIEIRMSIIHISIKIISNIIYSYINVFSKIIFENDYLTPYSLLLYKALFELVYLLIFSIIFIFIKVKDEPIFVMFGGIFDNTTRISLMIVLILISFFYNISILQLIDKFSPSNFIVARAFENFSSFIIDDLIYNNINKKSNDNDDNDDNDDETEYWIIISFKIIMYILIILASFIYNEFIVINICGLSKNTNLISEERAKKELRTPSDSTITEQDIGSILNEDEKY